MSVWEVMGEVEFLGAFLELTLVCIYQALCY